MTARTTAGVIGSLVAIAATGGWLRHRYVETGPGFGEDGLTTLASSCGNGTCDASLGEDDATCRYDCLDARTHAVGFYTEVAYCDGTPAIYHPTSIPGVQAAVRELVAAGKHVKAMGTGHSLARGNCSDGGIVALDGMTDIGPIEPWRGLDTVVIGPGVRFEQLGERLHAAGRSFGFKSTGWGHIGVVGSVLAGSHGSGTHEVASIHEQAVELTVVDQRGELVTYNAFDTDPETWRAVKVSVGALGIVVAARLETLPDRRLAYHVDRHRMDELQSPEGIAALTAGCDFSFLMAFPRSDDVLQGCGALTDAPVTDERLTNYLFSPDYAAWERDTFKPALQLSATSWLFEGIFERVTYDRFTTTSVGIEGEGGAPVTWLGNAGVGWNHRIVNLPRMAYELPPFSQIDYEVAVPLADLPEAMRIIDETFDAAGRTLPLTGIVIRFDQATDTSILAGNAAREGLPSGAPLAHVELPAQVPYGFRPEALAKYHAPAVTSVLRILDAVPAARLHLGKNNLDLMGRYGATGNLAEGMARFQRVVDQLDPYGVYANDYLRALGVRWPREGEPFATMYAAPGSGGG